MFTIKINIYKVVMNTLIDGENWEFYHKHKMNMHWRSL